MNANFFISLLPCANLIIFMYLFQYPTHNNFAKNDYQSFFTLVALLGFNSLQILSIKKVPNTSLVKRW